MIDNPRRLTALGWRIPLIVAFPGVAVFALALSVKQVFEVHQYSVIAVTLIILWFAGLILTIFSVITINWILNYRKKAHVVSFALDGIRTLSALVFDVRTVQDSVPVCPMSTRRAPRARRRSIS